MDILLGTGADPNSRNTKGVLTMGWGPSIIKCALSRALTHRSKYHTRDYRRLYPLVEPAGQLGPGASPLYYAASNVVQPWARALKGPLQRVPGPAPVYYRPKMQLDEEAVRLSRFRIARS